MVHKSFKDWEFTFVIPSSLLLKKTEAEDIVRRNCWIQTYSCRVLSHVNLVQIWPEVVGLFGIFFPQKAWIGFVSHQHGGCPGHLCLCRISEVWKMAILAAHSDSDYLFVCLLSLRMYPQIFCPWSQMNIWETQRILQSYGTGSWTWWGTWQLSCQPLKHWIITGVSWSTAVGHSTPPTAGWAKWCRHKSCHM